MFKTPFSTPSRISTALRVSALGTKLSCLITHLPNTLGNATGIIQAVSPDGYHQPVAVTF